MEAEITAVLSRRIPSKGTSVMKLFRVSWARLRSLFRKEKLDREFNAELTAHLELQIEDNLRAGMSPEEARRSALLKLGGLEQTKESVRDHRGLPLLETLLQDLRYALRTLRKSPAFTVAAMVTLSLGIGANTVIFSFSDLLLNHPITLQHMDRLVSIDVLRSNGDEAPLAAANLLDLRAQTESLDSLTSYQQWPANILGNAGAEEVSGVKVGDDFFATLDVKPAEGRAFLADEHQPGLDHVVVLSYGFWRREFAADPRLSGKSLKIDGENYDVVGVMPDRFQFPSGGPQFWVPLALNDALKADRTKGSLSAVGRLKPDASLDQSRAEMITIWSRLQAQYPEANRQWSLSVVPLRGRLVDEDSRQFAILFLCVAGFVLLIACVNVANLQLARATSRNRELTIRAALGAGRARIVRQLLTESLLLAAIGSLGGLLLAVWGVAIMRADLPAQVAQICDPAGMRVDPRAFIFTLLAAVVAGFLSGIVPAFRGSRLNLRATLETGSTRVAGGGQRLQRAFVVAEVILAMMLLFVAGLMVKGFYTLAHHQTGMEPDSLLTFHVQLSSRQYADASQRQNFYSQLLERLRGIPGLQAVSAASGVPYSFYENDVSVITENVKETAGAEPPTAMEESITDDYFRVLHIPLREGRPFDRRDGAGAPPVAVVSESMARRLWQGQEAVGRRLRLSESTAGGENWITVVGVVGDIRHEVYDRTFRSILYRPLAQVSASSAYFVLRSSSGDPHPLIPTVRSAIAELDNYQPVNMVQSMTEKISGQASALQFVASLMGLFGLVGILLSAAGIYGVITFSTTQRRAEIGIRMALGAQTGQILRMVIAQGFSLVTFGGIVGLTAGLVLARILSSFLYGVQAWDIAVFFTMPLILAVVTSVATLLPAARAASLDPMVALRYE
jgi:putative ABC transport system permease protein